MKDIQKAEKFLGGSPDVVLLSGFKYLFPLHY